MIIGKKGLGNLIIIILISIGIILGGTYLFTDTFSKKVDISWKNSQGDLCWSFDKTHNLQAGDIMWDCNKACGSKYHLVSKDYKCNTETGNVTCICGSPS